MPWPAYYHTRHVSEGTAYVTPSEFPLAIEDHKGKGQAWRYRNQWTTFVPSRGLSFKNVARMGAHDEGEFWDIVNAARRANIKPPTSLVDLFSSVYQSPAPKRSVIAPFRGFSFGGWEEALWRGNFPTTTYHYDLNSAYRWAACQGLPNLRHAFVAKDFNVPYGVFLVDLPRGVIPYERVGGIVMVTSEERDHFKLNENPDVEYIFGVGLRDNIDFTPVFAEVDAKFPAAIAKKISRSFWGMWNTRRAPEQVSFKTGATRQMRNPFYNPIWSRFLTSRVKLRMAALRADWNLLHVYVDAVLTAEPLPTGTAPGEWKLVGQYPSVWIAKTCYWGTGDKIIKAAGLPFMRRDIGTLTREQWWAAKMGGRTRGIIKPDDYPRYL